MELIARSAVVVAIVVSTAYTFVRVLQLTNSFARAVLATSVLIDLDLLLLWLLGIDRPLFAIAFRRLKTTITVTALTLALPLKVFLTLWMLRRTQA